MNALTRTTMPAPLKEYLRDPRVADQLSELRRLSPWRFVASALGNYLAIALAIGGVTLLASTTAGLSWPTTAAT